MSRGAVAMLHAGYWTLYCLLLVVILLMLRAPHTGPVMAGITASWPILILAVLPNAVAFYAGYAFGWVLVLLATFVINHFDLIGLRQVWRYLVGKPQAGLEFGTPFL